MLTVGTILLLMLYRVVCGVQASHGLPLSCCILFNKFWFVRASQTWV